MMISRSSSSSSSSSFSTPSIIAASCWSSISITSAKSWDHQLL
jgi:hypothetical protein